MLAFQEEWTTGQVEYDHAFFAQAELTETEFVELKKILVLKQTSIWF